ncbi:hypothetical protein FJU44_19775 [Acinetobacter baumannii]|nr:hypothetical protein FJU44_19775 [Acinetobacter baumannii]SSQ27595.1 Uncharacterised protein [Acinetobacter baumannii]SVK02626.1 Uncharacterised protein [Acinetobacter baumannii]HCQ9936275.1 hypothetical protein [Acinetobacter baumannii]HCV3097118.1 hypothetical protein [Acinetobacter baumannii]
MDERNLELEAWLIETAGEEMMANHLGPNWNKFDDEFGFYPNMAMTVADLVWQHHQAKVEELEKEWLEMNQQHEQAVKECFEVNSENRKLQKRVDQQGLIIAKAMSIASDLQKSWSMFEIGKKLEQAIKGEG